VRSQDSQDSGVRNTTLFFIYTLLKYTYLAMDDYFESEASRMMEASSGG
jgi:hypothetical protein